MTETARLVIAVDSSGADRATRSLDKLDRAAGGSERAASKLGKAWGVALGVISSAVVIGATRAFVRQADAFANMSARIGLVTKNGAELVKVQRQLFDLSQATSSDLESTTDLYVKLAQSSDTLRGNQELLLRTTELVSKSLVVSGTGAAGAAAAIRQFSQAMGAGALRGDEFISIMENAPRLARAIADGMGVPVGALRELAREGKLTAEAVVAAIESQGAVIDAEFGRMPLTVSRATQQVKNALTQMIGETDNASGASRGLAESIAELARVLESEETKTAFATLIQGLVGTAGFAVKATNAIAGLISKYNEWLQSKGFAPSDDLEEMKNRRDALQSMMTAPGMLGMARRGIGGDAIGELIDDLNRQIADRESPVTMVTGRADFSGVTGGARGGWEPRSSGATTGGGATAVRETATATRELTQAEQENALYQESLTRARGESLEMLRDSTDAQQRGQAATDALISDMEFELSLMGLSNVEREKAIALRHAGVDAMTTEGRAITGLVDEMEKAREAEGYITDLKYGLSDLFSSIGQGSEAASASFARMIDNMKRRAADALADRAINGLIEGFLGMMGGGGWAGFTSGFAKGWGGGRAGGGPVMAGQSYLVGESGPEVVTFGGNGRVTPNGGGAASPQISVSVHVDNRKEGGAVSASASTGGPSGRELEESMKGLFAKWTNEQTRQGGIFWKMQQGRV